jgi:hypothetical protein
LGNKFSELPDSYGDNTNKSVRGLVTSNPERAEREVRIPLVIYYGVLGRNGNGG